MLPTQDEQEKSWGAFVRKARSTKGVKKQNFLLVPLEDSRGEQGVPFAQLQILLTCPQD